MQVKTLKEALIYRSDRHLCKQGPLKVAEFYMESSHMAKLFRGFLLIKMQVVKDLTEGSGDNIVNPSPENLETIPQQIFTEEILVEIENRGRSITTIAAAPQVNQILFCLYLNILHFAVIKGEVFAQ